MPTVDANGITINYTVEGAGPPLIMLHGATSSPLEDWAAQRPSFRQAFRIYLPDARGHVFGRCGHAAPLEHTVEFNQLITTFLETDR